MTTTVQAAKMMQKALRTATTKGNAEWRAFNEAMQEGSRDLMTDEDKRRSARKWLGTQTAADRKHLATVKVDAQEVKALVDRMVSHPGFLSNNPF